MGFNQGVSPTYLVPDRLSGSYFLPGIAFFFNLVIMQLTDVIIRTFITPHHALETYRIFVSAKNLALDEVLLLPSVCGLVNNRPAYFEKVDSYRWKLFILR